MSSPDKFVVYLRVSTQRQGASGLGLEAQRQAVQAHVANVGGRIVGEFVEVESGTDDDRPELAKALSVASRSKAFILVAKCDRLARDVALVSAVMKGSMGLVDASNPTASTLELHLRACIAEEEARLVSARTSAALQVAKARGAKLGSARPGHWKGREHLRLAGLAKARAKLAESQEKNTKALRAEVLPIIRELVQQGWSFRAVAAHLNTKGIASTRGGTWSASTVIRMLKSA